jgi:hypothetical protein
MRYFPKRKTVAELLEARGFVSVNRGYEKMLIKEKTPWIVAGLVKRGITIASTRLHALITLDGGIDLHLDEPHPEDKAKHKSRRFCKLVGKEIEEFKKLDVAEQWYLRFWDTLFLYEA